MRGYWTYICIVTGTLFCAQGSQAQFSLRLDATANVFMEDEKIGAVNTPQYDDGLIGIESWLTATYRKNNWDIGLRLDFFSNTNLLNPTDAYSDAGIGRAHIQYHLDKVQFAVGYLYDQIGSGIIFRAYEERALLLDNALLGGRIKYVPNTKLQIMGFAGRQKNLFDIYSSTLAGVSLEAYALGREGENWSFSPGFGVVVKTLSDDQMTNVERGLGVYTPQDFISEVPYHSYAMTVYNTLQAGPVSWYIEVAYKTDEVYDDPNAIRHLWTGDTSRGRFVVDDGFVLYNALSYARKKFGVSLEYKLTTDFSFRADPFARLNRGLIGYLPPMVRFNTYRLTARYVPATQQLGELAGQIEFSYRLNRKQRFRVNGSYINDLNGVSLYREVLAETTQKIAKTNTLIAGVQFQWYNQELYEGKTGAPTVQTITGYTDCLIRFGRKKSLRTEAQFMHTKEDFGSWLFILAEFSIAPHWTFEVSDMWNIIPYEDPGGVQKNDPLHYPVAGVSYTVNAHRFSVRYVKQVEGVVCSGGICRLEPAFSGFRVQTSLSF
jgi:hypothetical protein